MRRTKPKLLHMIQSKPERGNVCAYRGRPITRRIAYFQQSPPTAETYPMRVCAHKLLFGVVSTVARYTRVPRKPSQVRPQRSRKTRQSTNGYRPVNQHSARRTVGDCDPRRPIGEVDAHAQGATACAAPAPSRFGETRRTAREPRGRREEKSAGPRGQREETQSSVVGWAASVDVTTRESLEWSEVDSRRLQVVHWQDWGGLVWLTIVPQRRCGGDGHRGILRGRRRRA